MSERHNLTFFGCSVTVALAPVTMSPGWAPGQDLTPTLLGTLKGHTKNVPAAAL